MRVIASACSARGGDAIDSARLPVRRRDRTMGGNFAVGGSLPLTILPTVASYQFTRQRLPSGQEGGEAGRGRILANRESACRKILQSSRDLECAVFKLLIQWCIYFRNVSC